MKQLELNISQQSLEREQAKLRVMENVVARDLAQIDTDINIMTAKLDNARAERERALVALAARRHRDPDLCAAGRACRATASPRSST